MNYELDHEASIGNGSKLEKPRNLRSYTVWSLPANGRNKPAMCG